MKSGRKKSLLQKKFASRKKIIVIVGPTASGKSSLAVEIARKIGGEVISADSRQVYRGLDIGTGKITRREMHGVPHHLLDVALPTARKVFTVDMYKRLADQAIEDILHRKKIPIICGGTGFYIQAVANGIILPEVPPDQKLRKQLEKKSAKDLIKILTKLDPVRAKTIDRQNPRRLVRAIEIARTLGKVPRIKSMPKYDPIFIGIEIPPNELKRRIASRLKKRLKQGMVNEAKRLHSAGLSWKRMEDLGLEYRYLARYLQGKISHEEMERELLTAIWQYSRRQKQWFRRDRRVKWFSPTHITQIFHLLRS